MDTQEIWARISREAAAVAGQEPLLAPLIENTITAAPNLANAVARVVCTRLGEPPLFPVFENFAKKSGAALEDKVAQDLAAILKNDPAADELLTPFLFFKGFHALQAHRLAYDLWHGGRKHLACFVQSCVSTTCGVDIHPAAQLGAGIMMDHATGIVIGETAVVEDGVLFWHGVTLGGSGRHGEDRHPKIGKDVQLGAEAVLLGRITVGAGAKVGAGSIVVKDIPAGVTVISASAEAVKKK